MLNEVIILTVIGVVVMIGLVVVAYIIHRMTVKMIEEERRKLMEGDKVMIG